ncbi:hypothetical protein MJO28_017247 [Puccinia striiformis f. sp. tritici]|nr:hypothetical protein MJO28_017247 [Puccinia striiformis f. sp. tritici]
MAWQARREENVMQWFRYYQTFAYSTRERVQTVRTNPVSGQFRLIISASLRQAFVSIAKESAYLTYLILFEVDGSAFLGIWQAAQGKVLAIGISFLGAYITLLNSNKPDLINSAVLRNQGQLRPSNLRSRKRPGLPFKFA